MDNAVKIIVAIVPPLLTLIGVIITTMLVPYLKSKKDLNTAEKRKVILDNIRFWVDIAVRSAEQIYKDMPKSGAEKKQFVLNYLQKKGLDITDEDLNILIESAVKELNLIEQEWLSE